MTNGFSLMMIGSRVYLSTFCTFFVAYCRNLKIFRTRACNNPAKLSFIFNFFRLFFSYKNSLEDTLDYITFIIQQYAAILSYTDILNGKCLYTSLQLPSVFINHNFNFSLSTLLYKLLQHKLFP